MTRHNDRRDARRRDTTSNGIACDKCRKRPPSRHAVKAIGAKLLCEWCAPPSERHRWQETDER
jgi:hypothetical protein